MSAAAGHWPFPGLVWGDYPEQAAAFAPSRVRGGRGTRHCRDFAVRVLALPLPTAEDLASRLAALRAGAAKGGEDWLLQAFRLGACAMRDSLGFVPHAQQIAAARLVVENRLVELPTGDGKTAAIALAAAVAALGRTPVHVVTANDYLAQRDARALRSFYQLLGVAVAHIAQPMAAAQRRAAYGHDVTYCTAKELAFDYLRDAMARGSDLSPLEMRARRMAAGTGGTPVLRGLCMAILDEADTVLIDEARVPLVLSQPAGEPGEEAFHESALALAARMEEGRHFQPQGRGFALSGEGRALLGSWPPDTHPLHGHAGHREATLLLALTALHSLRRDADYVVRGGKVALVDETTGRAAQGRAWSRGLHQLVELKEGLPVTRRNATISQISFQQFFPRYLRLAGMSGTLAGAAGEMRAVYGLRVAVLQPRVPRLVRHARCEVLPDSAALWLHAANAACSMAAQGRPVLVGTDSVAQSEALAQVLRARGVPHRVLHAREDAAESEVVARAGRAGSITVATSMAGRGTDILLDAQVAQRGGLHIILCQHNASPRIDRQFLGRAGRNGQPGSAQALLALDFPLLQRWLPGWWRALLRRTGCPAALARSSARLAQWLESSAQKRQRIALRRASEGQERDLTFSRRTSS